MKENCKKHFKLSSKKQIEAIIMVYTIHDNDDDDVSVFKKQLPKQCHFFSFCCLNLSSQQAAPSFKVISCCRRRLSSASGYYSRG